MLSAHDDGVYVELNPSESNKKSPVATRPRRTPLRRKAFNLQEPSEDLAVVAPFVEKDHFEAAPSAYEHAKTLFHRSARVRMVGRTLERSLIEKFWNSAVDPLPQTAPSHGSVAKSLYICGNPGTGKTALLQEMLPELIEKSRLKIRLVQINCMMQSSAKEIVGIILNELGLGRRVVSASAISSNCTKLKCRVVLVLDEVDQLTEKNLDLLETIFGWSQVDNGQIRVIGIANSLDMTIKHLTSASNLIEVINFSPYSPEDISRILMARLEMVTTRQVAYGETDENLRSPMSIISPVAVEMCARKVSSVGDLRKALEIMRDAINLAEKEHSNTRPEASTHPIQSPMFVQVSIKHVVVAMEKIFGTTARTKSRHTQMINELNLHQKLLLTTLYRLLQDSAGLKPSVNILYDRYSALLRQHPIVELVSRSEFGDLVSNAESMGILSTIAPGKRVKGRALDSVASSGDFQVVLSIPLEDVQHGLSDNHLFKKLILF